ncbi:MAG: PaaI family thioesterase [Bryobacterales bacterium]|nr:PaaI family thioesterase [Bryobacterales bacterium]
MALESKAFHESVGIELVQFHEDGATMRLELGDIHLNGAGVVHGGVTFTLADSALGYGIYKIVGKPCTTAEMKINYLKPVSRGVLTARSYILRAGRRLVVARAEVRCGEEAIAEALSTFAILD